MKYPEPAAGIAIAGALPRPKRAVCAAADGPAPRAFSSLCPGGSRGRPGAGGLRKGFVLTTGAQQSGSESPRLLHPSL